MTLPSDSVTLHSQRQCDVLCNRKSEIRQEPQTKALLYLMQICVYIYESCCADIGYQEGKNAISHSPCSVSAVTNEQQFTLGKSESTPSAFWFIFWLFRRNRVAETPKLELKSEVEAKNLFLNPYRHSAFILRGQQQDNSWPVNPTTSNLQQTDAHLGIDPARAEKRDYPERRSHYKDLQLSSFFLFLIIPLRGNLWGIGESGNETSGR